ncbi:hypothetical protein Q8F55_001490 [Vanrija albida]|uniref:Proteasome activator PA28 C-terminal domain-containing protein n=1 Tax=Vanrija albida TaxID=181172 RepID=A0ABR3QG55_9TREE
MTTPEPVENITPAPTPTPPPSSAATPPPRPPPPATTLAIRVPSPGGSRSLTVRVPLVPYAPRSAIDVVATLTQLPMYLDGVRREVLRWEAEERARAAPPPPSRSPLGLQRRGPTRGVGKSRVDSGVRFEARVEAPVSAATSASSSAATSPTSSHSSLDPETPPTPPAALPVLLNKPLYPSYDTPPALQCHHHPYARPLSAIRPGPPRPQPPSTLASLSAARAALDSVSALAATYVRLDLLMTEIEAGTTRQTLPPNTLAALAAQRTAYLAVLRRELYAWVRRLPGADERRELRGLVRGLARVLAELGRGLEAGLSGINIIEH